MLERTEISLVRRLFIQPLNTLLGSAQNRVQVHEEALVQSAFTVFQEKYPKWANSCFDIYFLEHSGREAVQSKSADALTKAYLAQVPSFDEGDAINNLEKVALVRTVAEDFLNILAIKH